MAILQPLIDLAAVCHAHGIRHAVISPGSRSAPLTLAFARHPGIQVQVCIDERSAGFIALGIAQQISSPVVLVCTSGSATYNLAPAISEAFFQQIPLLVLTADRPAEWLHQYDGQTIYQSGIYGKHVKRSFEFSSDYSHKDAVWSINRIANEAINLASTLPHGPVHINVPVREPFYPSQTDEFTPSKDIRIIKRNDSEQTLTIAAWHELLDVWEDSERILIAGGQHLPDEKLSKVLARISEEWEIPVVADCITNLNGSDLFIRHHDLFLRGKNLEKLTPDLLITFGLSFISKDLKLFLRKNPAIQHWHVGQDPFLADPTQSLTRQIPVNANYFFEQLFEQLDYQSFVENSNASRASSYSSAWQHLEATSRVHRYQYLRNLSSLNDLNSLDIILSSLNNRFQLHIGNSMAIRYANILGVESNLGTYSNRGTSGIDGCLSTAIGAAIVNCIPTLLIIGDVSFLYDRNGLLINSFPQNLKIVVINNGGGNIFRMIDGPAGLPELSEYFETRHTFTSKRSCEDACIDYFEAHDLDSLVSILPVFLDSNLAGLLEVFTDPEQNDLVWKAFRSEMNAQL